MDGEHTQQKHVTSVVLGGRKVAVWVKGSQHVMRIIGVYARVSDDLVVLRKHIRQGGFNRTLLQRDAYLPREAVATK